MCCTKWVPVRMHHKIPPSSQEEKNGKLLALPVTTDVWISGQEFTSVAVGGAIFQVVRLFTLAEHDDAT